MIERSYKEIIAMVKNGCNATFYNGSKGIEDTVVQCATQIYIEQMKIQAKAN